MPTCDSCGAEMRWAKTTNGKPIPLDPYPVERGNIMLNRINGEEIATVLSSKGAEEARERGTALYVSHFATCPQAPWHRKPR